jgi:hypothetical protein
MEFLSSGLPGADGGVASPRPVGSDPAAEH